MQFMNALYIICDTFRATVVERPHIWYMDDGQLIKTLCPVMPRRRQSSRSSTFNRNTPPQQPEQNSNAMMKKDLVGSNNQPTTFMSPKIPHQTAEDGRTSSSSTNSEIPQVPVAAVHPKLKCCACDEAKYEVHYVFIIPFIY